MQRNSVGPDSISRHSEGERGGVRLCVCARWRPAEQSGAEQLQVFLFQNGGGEEGGLNSSTPRLTVGPCRQPLYIQCLEEKRKKKKFGLLDFSNGISESHLRSSGTFAGLQLLCICVNNRQNRTHRSNRLLP